MGSWEYQIKPSDEWRTALKNQSAFSKSHAIQTLEFQTHQTP